MYGLTCWDCGEQFPVPADYDPDHRQFCPEPECQFAKAEHEAGVDTRYALWNENVEARRRGEMTRSELHVAQDALVAVTAVWL